MNKRYNNFSDMSSAELYQHFDQYGFIVESYKDETVLDTLDIPSVSKSKRRGTVGFVEPTENDIQRFISTVKFAVDKKQISPDCGEFLFDCAEQLDKNSLQSLNTAVMRICRPSTEKQLKALEYYYSLAKIYPEMAETLSRLASLDRYDRTIFNCASYAIREFKRTMTSCHRTYPSGYEVKAFLQAFRRYYGTAFNTKKKSFFGELDREEIQSITEELNRKSSEYLNYFEEYKIEVRDRERAQWYSEDCVTSLNSRRHYDGYKGMIGECFDEDDLKEKEKSASEMACDLWESAKRQIKA